jgi:hypothetical protein
MARFGYDPVYQTEEALERTARVPGGSRSAGGGLYTSSSLLDGDPLYSLSSPTHHSYGASASGSGSSVGGSASQYGPASYASMGAGSALTLSSQISNALPAATPSPGPSPWDGDGDDEDGAGDYAGNLDAQLAPLGGASTDAVAETISEDIASQHHQQHNHHNAAHASALGSLNDPYALPYGYNESYSSSSSSSAAAAAAAGYGGDSAAETYAYVRDVVSRAALLRPPVFLRWGQLPKPDRRWLLWADLAIDAAFALLFLRLAVVFVLRYSIDPVSASSGAGVQWLAPFTPYFWLPSALHAPFDASLLLGLAWLTWASFSGLYLRFASLDAAHLLHVVAALFSVLLAAALCAPARALVPSSSGAVQWPWVWAAYAPWLCGCLLTLRAGSALAYARLAWHDIGRAYALVQIAYESAVAAPLLAAILLPDKLYLLRSTCIAAAALAAAVAALVPRAVTPKRFFIFANCARQAERYGQLVFVFFVAIVIAALVTVPGAVVRAAAASDAPVTGYPLSTIGGGAGSGGGLLLQAQPLPLMRHPSSGLVDLGLASGPGSDSSSSSSGSGDKKTKGSAGSGAAAAAFALPLTPPASAALGGAAPMLSESGTTAAAATAAGKDKSVSPQALLGASPVLAASARSLVVALAPVVATVLVLVCTLAYLYVQVDAGSEHDKHALARRGAPAFFWAAAHPLLLTAAAAAGTALFDLAPLLAAPAGSAMLRTVTAAVAADAAAVVAVSHYSPLSPRQLLALSLVAALAALALLRLSHVRATVASLVAAAYPQAQASSSHLLASPTVKGSGGGSGGGYATFGGSSTFYSAQANRSAGAALGAPRPRSDSSSSGGSGFGGFDSHGNPISSSGGVFYTVKRALRYAGRWLLCGCAPCRRTSCFRRHGAGVGTVTCGGRPWFLVAFTAARALSVLFVALLLLAAAWAPDAADGTAAGAADERAAAWLVVALAVLTPVLACVASHAEDMGALWCFKRSLAAAADGSDDAGGDDAFGSGASGSGGGVDYGGVGRRGGYEDGDVGLGASPLGPQPGRAGYFAY